MRIQKVIKIKSLNWANDRNIRVIEGIQSSDRKLLPAKKSTFAAPHQELRSCKRKNLQMIYF